MPHAPPAAAINDHERAASIFPLVYDELRRLAAQRLAALPPGQTLQPTALVHEVFLRLAGGGAGRWAGREHFLHAAAEAMRHVLIDRARRRGRVRHGGDRHRVPLPDLPAPDREADALVCAHEAVDKLAVVDESAARLAKLHLFAGLTVEECAEVLHVSPRTAYRDWAFARAWMYRLIAPDETER